MIQRNKTYRRETRTGWIIMNKIQNKIWKDVYLSKNDAESEFKYQISKLSPYYHAKNWKLESFDYEIEIETQGSNKDFDDFEKF